MTEDEAKTKWCFAFTASHTDPRAREYVDSDGAFDASASGPFRHHCIGSECMAWRNLPDPMPCQNDARSQERTPGSWGGFCGLAGRPA